MKCQKFVSQVYESFRGIQPKIDQKISKYSYIISIKDLANGNVCFENVRKDHFIVPESRSSQRLQDGDLIICLRGTSLKAAVFEIPKNHPDYIFLLTGCYLDENLAGFRLNCNNAKIIAAYLNSDVGQQYLDTVATGTRVKSLSVKNIENMIIPLPVFEIQKELLRFLDASEMFIQRIEQEKEIVNNVRNAVIKKYMEVS